jgi:IS5 family transposase
VELLVEGCSQKRKAEPRGSGKLEDHANDAAPRSVASRVGWRERDLQWRIKSAGGRRDPVRKIRRLRRNAVERLGLLHRVVGGGS